MVTADVVRFSLAQTTPECPGTYVATVRLSEAGGSGQFAGKDCMGERQNGVFTLKRAGSAESDASAVKIRVFIVDRDSFEASGGFVGTVGSIQAGIRRINTEQVKTFAKACPDVSVINTGARADFLVVWDTKTWQQTSWGGHQNEFGVYNVDGELVGSGATHKTTNAAKEICKIIVSKKAPATSGK